MRGAIFDMDGVLFDTERLYQITWREIASERGITLPEDFTKAVSGAAKDAVTAAVKRFYRTEQPEEVIREEYERMRIKQEEPLPIKDGVMEMLSFLKENGWRMAVASSTYHDQVKKNLERNGLAEYFSEVIGGDEVEKAKPEPDIFLAAAEKIGLPPQECCVFEDSFNGIRAAAAAGTSPIMVVDLLEPDEEIRELSDHVFPNMKTALDFLRGI